MVSSMNSRIISFDELEQMVSNIRGNLTSNQISDFLEIVGSCFDIQTTCKELHTLKASPSKINWLRSLISSLPNNEVLTVVSFSLYDSIERRDPPPVEIYWTGPSENSSVRMTWSALSELVLSAERSITLVGYNISRGMGKILDYLEMKQNEGVRLCFLIDRYEKKESFKEWLSSLSIKPEVYDRPEDEESPFTSLHVKCVVVDERVAMFGSANLTKYGTLKNIELGITIRDQIAVRTIVSLLEDLKESLIRIE